MEKLKDWDEMIRQGALQRVQRELDQLVLSAVPRKSLAAVAQIARRVGSPEIGLKLLSPVVRPKNRGLQRPTPEERLEYAVLLQRIGSLTEAWGILSSSDIENRAEAFLYKSYVLFNEWKYEEAIPLLLKYSQHPEVPAYQRLVGRVNLLGAYAFENHPAEEESLFAELEKELREAKHQRLLGNIFEIRAGACFRRLDISGAKESIAEAERMVQENAALDSYYIQKWKLILEAYDRQDISLLFDFKEKARELGHAEVERDSDFHMLLIQFDPRRAQHLYAGTPFETYRTRMCRLLGLSSQRSAQEWRPSMDPYTWGREGELLDLIEAVWRGEALFKPNSLQHRALLCLSADLYQAKNVGGLFSDLYPDEYFDVDSSTLRIHQLIKRMREVLEESSIPLEIALTSSGYKLRKLEQNFQIRMPILKKTEQTFGTAEREKQVRLKLVEQLKSHFGSSLFKAAEAGEVLSLSKSSLHRRIAEMEADHLIEAVGSGRGKLYRVR